MNLDHFKPKTVYVTYIATTPDKVWHALTTGDFTRQFFFGRRIEVELQPGGTFRFWQPDGTLDVEGKVVECDPPRKLSVTWRVMWMEEMRKLPECLVTYQIDDLGKVVRLTMTEAHQIELDDRMLEGGRRGWPVILNNLKTLLETGQPMPEFDFMGDAKNALEELKQAAREQTGGG
ncbi:MAG: SRPBCC family protein [Chthoniobacter sp.]|nr:SRPBCC family protein [Chthoniobacter sp.]